MEYVDEELKKKLSARDVPQDVIEMSEYFSRPDVIEQLLGLMLRPFGEEEEMKSRVAFTQADNLDELPDWVKFSVKATEILSMDVRSMIPVLFSEKHLLEKLFSFLDLETVNPWLALKVTGCVYKLFLRYPADMVAFIEQLQLKKPVVKRLVHHISSPPFCNFLGSLLTGAISEDGQPFPVDHEWWLSNNLITDIYDLIEAGDDDQVIAGCRFLTDLVRRYNPYECSKLMPFIEAISEENNLRRLVRVMVESEKADGHSLVFQEGVGLLATVLSVDKHVSIYKEGNGEEKITTAVLNATTEALGDFKNILKNPGPGLNPAPVTWQSTPHSPLGPVRVKVMELMTYIATARPATTHPLIVSSGIMHEILRLCKEYEMSNIAHCHLHEIIDAAIPKTADAECYGVLLTHLINDCKLPELIIECNAENDAQLAEKSYGKGYMGLITLLSEMLETPWPKSATFEIPSPSSVEGWSKYITNSLAPRLDIEGNPWPQGGSDEYTRMRRDDEVRYAEPVSSYIGSCNVEHQPDYESGDGTAESKYKVSNNNIMSRYHNSIANERDADETNHHMQDMEGFGFIQEFGDDIINDEGVKADESESLEWENVRTNVGDLATRDFFERDAGNIIESGIELDRYHDERGQGAYHDEEDARGEEEEEEHQVQEATYTRMLNEIPTLLPSHPHAIASDSLRPHIPHPALAASPIPAAHPNLIRKLEEIHSHPLQTDSDDAAEFNSHQCWMLPLEGLDEELGEG